MMGYECEMRMQALSGIVDADLSSGVSLHASRILLPQRAIFSAEHMITRATHDIGPARGSSQTAAPRFLTTHSD